MTGPVQHSRSAGTPSTSGRPNVTPRPQNSKNIANLQLHAKRVGGGYDLSEEAEGAPLCKPGAVNQALRALPALEHPYSQYDLDLIAEILRRGDAQVQKELCSGAGSGEVSCSVVLVQAWQWLPTYRLVDTVSAACYGSQLTLLKLLQAYEAVLKKHNISASEDTYYYRLLLKLSLEPSPDWWGKFYRECEQNARYIFTSLDHMVICPADLAS